MPTVSRPRTTCGWTRGAWRLHDRSVSTARPRTLDRLLTDAERRIDRLEPRRAWAEAEAGATIVDVRSEVSRARDGVVPGALHVPLTVFAWRLAPDSEWRSPWAPGTGDRVIVLCDHGCSSVLAAATLVDLGFSGAADVIGGYEAWREAGLPTRPGPAPAAGRPTGMAPPDPV
jgi:rhodanese-related sulfurtransferase